MLMNIQETLAEFYQSNPLKLSADLKTEITHFDVIDLNSAYGDVRISIPFSRRTYYTLTLLHGSYTIEFDDQVFNVTGDTLLFTTPKIPFGIQGTDGEQKGAFCIFTESFITKHNSGYRLQEFPIFKPGRQHIYSLSADETKVFTGIFGHMFNEKLENSDFSESLLRTHALQIILNAQKLSPVATYLKKNRTAEEITCGFVRLLEQQFPIESPQDQIKLKLPKDFANKLSMHPVYLNRQVKLTKERTVSDMIAGRIMQEAKVLLKLHNWNIAEIAYCLGFEEPSHFNSFFKKHLHISPTDYRNLKE